MPKIYRKFFRDLTEDDKPWGFECDLTTTFLFLSSPSAFLRTNIDATCVLAQDFVVKIRPSKVSPPMDGRFFVTGNSGTNIVTVFVPAGAFPRHMEFLTALAMRESSVLELMTETSLTSSHASQAMHLLLTTEPLRIDILVVMEPGSDQGRAVCHFKIIDDLEPGPRALYLAGWILQLIDDPTKLHSYFKDGDKHPTYVDPNGNPLPIPPNPITFLPFTSPGDLDNEYAGSEERPLQACEMLLGLYHAGLITAEEAYIKAYA